MNRRVSSSKSLNRSSRFLDVDFLIRPRRLGCVGSGTGGNGDSSSPALMISRYLFLYSSHLSAGSDLVILINSVVENLPRGRAYLADQLQRAGTSVPLNIAEGAGEFSSNEKIRFYRMARRSATECAGIFDVCQRLDIIDEKNYSKSRELLMRIVAMLTKMARSFDKS